jgi:tetratricopeptide (TPR) repeat protein
MNHARSILLIVGWVTMASIVFLDRGLALHTTLAPITIDYPAQDSIFPPDIEAPTFLWRDAEENVRAWRIEVAFADGSQGTRVESQGERLRVGEIDPRCVSSTNKLPELTPVEVAQHIWKPDAGTWEHIKQHASARTATVTITGFRDGRAVSRGQVRIQASKDPVGAPIFYRDVPLMPATGEKGIIRPISTNALPLIAWRLRNIAEPRSRVVLEGLPTCANCHSFSADGKTFGMDIDGPENDKGLYALVSLGQRTSIRSEDLVSWNRSGDRQFGQNRVGFMSQVSPDGQYVVTTISGTKKPMRSNFYVANFRDYRFLQVFYPTSGILAWYSRAAGVEQSLPGADDPHYVQTGGFWSPDGKYLVFARAKAKSAYPEGGKMAEFANDPNEIQIQYDLYRILFNEGRGGHPEPIDGASRNGASNTFPKVSPDGRWIVFVKCRNGQLMRPDGQLYIVPAQGGVARRMRCNTPLMNSWHSFSPNGHWMVFSSKARSPYTQMYLTHIDEYGNDSPAILIENSTAANRGVNIPEFVNIPPDRPFTIEVPAVAVYAEFNRALELAKKGHFDEAAPIWEKALKANPDDARAHGNLGSALALARRFDEAIPHFEEALKLRPEDADLHDLLGIALGSTGKTSEALVHFSKAVELAPQNAKYLRDLAQSLAEEGRLDEAILQFEQALRIDPDLADAHYYLGVVLYIGKRRTEDALAHWREALRLQPDALPVLRQTARVLATTPDDTLRNGAEAVALAQKAVDLSGGKDPSILETLAAAYAEQRQFSQAIDTAQRALTLAAQQNDEPLAVILRKEIVSYQMRNPWREAP